MRKNKNNKQSFPAPKQQINRSWGLASRLEKRKVGDKKIKKSQKQEE